MTKDQHKRPIGRGRERLLYAAVAVLLLDLGGAQANGQIYPDPKMTKLFENRLEALAKSHTRVFVSDCNLSRVADEKAILTIPIGSSSGTLLLLSKFYNTCNPVENQDLAPTISVLTPVRAWT